MSAPNFLGLRCPKCGETEGLDICLFVWARLTEEGSDLDEAHNHDRDIDPNSSVFCTGCEYNGTMEEFETDEEKTS